MKAIGFTSLAMAMHVGDWDGAHCYQIQNTI